MAGAAAALALGGAGCKGDRPPSPAQRPKPKTRGLDAAGVLQLLMSTSPHALPNALAATIADGTSVAALVAGTALVGARHCRSKSYDDKGTVSHSLLGLLPSLRLAQRLPPKRQLVPLIVSSIRIAREGQALAAEPVPRALADCGQQCNLETFVANYRSDAPQRQLVGHADALASQGNSIAALAALASIALRQRGHGGHGIIMVAGTGRLLRDHGCGSEVLRAPSVYLSSFDAPDDTDERVDAARSGRGGRFARRAIDGEPLQLLAGCVADAATWFNTVDGDLFGPLHVITSIAAANDAIAMLGDVPLPAINRREIALRTATWLDRSVENRPAKQARPSTAAKDLKSAILASDQTDAVASARRDGLDVHWTVELAVATARPTIQHSVKLLDAALHATGAATAPQRRETSAAAARFLARSSHRIDATYFEVLEALALRPPAQFPRP